jgi:hypothetical protein
MDRTSWARSGTNYVHRVSISREFDEHGNGGERRVEDEIILPIIVFALLVNRYIVSGLTQGAVKG